VFGDKIGVGAKAVARALDLDHDGMVQEPVEVRGGLVCLNTSRGVFRWLGRSFHAAAGIGVGTVVYA
jgi:hypothetical protein